MSLRLKSLGYETPRGDVIFQNLNLVMNPGRKHGLVGPNGVGKTTLARLLMGQLEPTAGSVRVDGLIRFFAQSEKAPGIFLGDYLGPLWERLSPPDRAPALALLGGLSLTAKCPDLSGGEWTRARLARTFTQEADWLVFDEPTNNLDRTHRGHFLDFVRQCPHGLLIISHDRELLEEMDVILELSNRGLSVFGGNWSFYDSASRQERRRRETKLERSKNAVKKSEKERGQRIQRQEKRQSRGQAKADKGGLPRILIGGLKRAAQATAGQIDHQTQEALHRRVDETREALEGIKAAPQLYAEFPETRIPASKLVFEAQDFLFRFPGDSADLWRDPVHLTLRGPVKIALEGDNGAGKSTFLRLLLEPEKIEGTRRGSLKPGALEGQFLDQKLSQLEDDLSLLENVALTARKDPASLRNLMAPFLFMGDKVHQKAGTLSGGERLRLALAKALLADPAPQLLVLDEPTNNVDVLNVEFLEAALRKFQGALIVVSHDENFLENIGVERRLRFVAGRRPPD
ncbi:MAG: ABC-F family ATP-binding cassette domain-containing protein [Bdellovibrionaceae bacterium]|nr:ABC-F family ATP-binding cassette domain-containing protein [Pseudobdellovibrionaceae bacterium]